jgi:hypothetical protein
MLIKDDDTPHKLVPVRREGGGWKWVKVGARRRLPPAPHAHERRESPLTTLEAHVLGALMPPEDAEYACWDWEYVGRPDYALIWRYWTGHHPASPVRTLCDTEYCTNPFHLLCGVSVILPEDSVAPSGGEMKKILSGVCPLGRTLSECYYYATPDARALGIVK